VDGFRQVEEEILDVMDVECFDEVEDRVKECIQNWDIYS
jgi:tetrahydromethanopterin S-methyltransferase subunit A